MSTSMRSRSRRSLRTDARGARRLAAIVVLSIGALLPACARTDAAESPSPPADTSRPLPTTAAGSAERHARVGQFVANCPFSHRSPDDPIVHPHADGHMISSAHSHDFYGNTTTDGHSTTRSLLDATTNCTVAADLSAYWTPTLSKDGVPITAEQFVAYYDTAPGIDPATVSPLPAGLVMIAGNGDAIGVPPNRPVGWTCGRLRETTATVPSCPFTSPLTLHLTFPDCWDGRHLDSDDHRHHVAYSTEGQCPPEQPVPMIRLLLRVRYPVYGDPSGLAYSSGTLATAHADFMNAWTDKGMAEFLDLCIRRRIVCGEA